MVRVAGFEPTASWSRNQARYQLRYTRIAASLPGHQGPAKQRSLLYGIFGRCQVWKLFRSLSLRTAAPRPGGTVCVPPGLIASLVQCFFSLSSCPFRPRITMAAAPAREAASSARYSASWAVSPVGTESSGSSGCPGSSGVSGISGSGLSSGSGVGCGSDPAWDRDPGLDPAWGLDLDPGPAAESCRHN